MTASAPGKAFLCGEYVVTEGATAIVAAVNRRVEAGWQHGGDGHPAGPEARAAFDAAREAFGGADDAPALERGALFRDGRKLGLGSSAAGAVAVAGAVAARRGLDPSDADCRRAVLDCALRGHQRVAPGGSGADVAAAVYGGILAFRRSDDRSARVERLALPSSLALSIVWTGKSVRTSDLLECVARLRQTRSGAYGRTMSAVREAAACFVDAFSRGDAAAVVDATQGCHRAMEALGRASGAPIVESRLAHIVRLARAEGGAAKPSGAGGGDIALAFFEEDRAAARFEERCRKAGFTPISVVWGAEGVRAETARPGEADLGSRK